MEPLNKYDQLYKLALIACMFEAEPRHLLEHVTTLTPLLICNCPQPVRNTTLGEKRKAMYAVCIPKLHSCLHSWSPCVCYSTRSGFQELCFWYNNLILVGQPGRWKQQTAQNGLSLLVSLAKGLCPSRLHLQQTANPVHVWGAPRGQVYRNRRTEGASASALTHMSPACFILNKKTHVTHLIFKVSCQSPHPPLQALIQVGKALSMEASHVDIEKQMEMKSLWFHVAVTPKTTSGMMGKK